MQDPLGDERIVTLAGATSVDAVAALTLAARPDLASASVSSSSTNELWIDGRVVDEAMPLAASGLRRGSLVQVKSLTPAGGEYPPGRPSPLVPITWTSGPDTARTVTLPAGRWVVGRSTSADVRADDPQLAAHQGVLTIDYDATVRYCDLGVGRPAGLNGEPIGNLAIITATDSLTIGAGTLSIGPGRAKGTVSRDGEVSPARPEASVSLQAALHPWSEVVNRPPRHHAPKPPPPLPVPDLDTGSRTIGSGVGIVSAVTTLAGGIVMAVVLHQLVLMIMVGVGAAVAIITALIQTVRHTRGTGRTLRRTAAAIDRFADALDERRLFTEATERTAGLSLAVALHRGESGAGVWETRPDDPGFLTAELGRGDRRSTPALDTGPERLAPVITDLVIAHSLLHDVPIRLAIDAGDVVGVCGERHSAEAIVRSLICQWATASGPADWTLVVLKSPASAAASHAARRWEWTKWLPQFCHELASDDDLLAVCEAAADADRRVVVITDRATHLSTRTTPLRRAMSSPTTKVSVVTIADDVAALSSLCTGIIQANVDGSAVWQDLGVSDGVVQRFDLVGASEPTALLIASRLGRSDDPELRAIAGGNLGQIELLELLGRNASTPALIAEQWERGGHDIAPAALIGQSSSGTIEIDLERDGPHGLIAGTTGAGKSELLRTIVVALSAASPPEQLAFVLIDYKGGAAFDRCAALPHVVGMVTDLDEHLAGRVLRSLDAEIRRREQLLRDAGVADLGDYRAASARSASAPTASVRSSMTRTRVSSHLELARLVIVVDEFAVMATELPGFLSSLVSVAQRGRSLGMHLLLATQRPAGVVNDDIRANTNMRIALRVHDTSDSTDVIGDPLAASLPRRRPGRAVIRLGADELETFQAARCTGPAPPAETIGLRIIDDDASTATTGDVATSLDVAVSRIGEAARSRDREPPHRPWLDPLPAVLPRSELGGEGVGIVDLPDDQRRGVLAWTPDDGHLVIAGVLGSGATTALVSVVLDAAERAEPAALHIYVIDAAGSSTFELLADLIHCAGVVRVSESERRARTLDRLRQLTVARAATGTVAGEPRVLLVIDGLGALRSQLLEASRPDELVDLERIIADGPAAGISVAASVDGAGSIPPSLASRAASRWVLRLTDVGEATALGVPRESWPTRMPPGRGVVGGSGLEFQIGMDTEPIDRVVNSINARHSPVSAPRPVEVLPSTIDAARLDRAEPRGPGVHLDFGLRGDELSTATLCLFDGEQACVGGASRSGRTAALVTLAGSWLRQFPEGLLTVVAPRSIDRFVAAGIVAADVGRLDPQSVVRQLADTAPTVRDEHQLIVVDDAELVDDIAGFLQEAVGSNRSGSHIVVGARIETLRGYGHWCAGIKRSRKGLLLGALSDVDGDMLGVFLPRQNGTPPLAGRGFLVADGRADLVHVAETTTAASTSTSASPMTPTATATATIALATATATAADAVVGG